MSNINKLTGVGIVPEQAKAIVDVVQGGTVAALTPVSTADATDAATVITLANANKAKINAIIAALQA